LAPLKIRNTTVDDAPEIAAIQVAASRTAYAGIVPADYLKGLTVPTRAAAWAQLIATANEPERIMVGEEADCVRGYTHFGRSRDLDATETTGELYSLYVNPISWRREVDRELLAVSCSGLGDSGFNTATLWVLAANRQARCFYERCGWNSEGTEKGLDDSLIDIRYRLQLSTSAY
jgi:ribosomal protein S18 acetylase RimI-like enzyme